MAERIERETLIGVPPETVWSTVTSDGWLADDVDLQLWSGGEARFQDGATTKSGWVEDVHAPERLTFWWSEDGVPATRVELTLTPEGDATRLRVVETRPLDMLDLLGIPLHGIGGRTYGPALVAA